MIFLALKWLVKRAIAIFKLFETNTLSVHYQQLVKEKADKSHNCDEDTERGEEVDACDLVDTCEKQGGHNHPGVGHTQHSWLT